MSRVHIAKDRLSSEEKKKERAFGIKKEVKSLEKQNGDKQKSKK
jgi:hypothetical protein